MSEQWPPQSPQPTGTRPGSLRRGPLLPTVVIVGALVVAFLVFVGIYTDYLWFDQLGFASVLTTRLLWQTGLFLAGAAAMAASVWVSLSVAYRTRPIYAPTTPEQASLDRYRETLEPLRRVVAVAVPSLLGLFAGSAAAGQWQDVLLFINRQPFGTVDPVFGIDVGFYVFTLPLLQFAVGFATAVVLLSGIAAAVTHYLYGGLRVAGEGPRTTVEARVHLAVLAAVFLLVRALGYWLERYGLLNDEGDTFAGPGYTGANAVIPARTVLAVAAVLVALAFLYTAARGNWRIPALGTALLVVVAVVAGGIVPQLVQQLRVVPNQLDRERDYIADNISATRQAYDLADIDVQPFSVETGAERGALADDARTLPGIRLLDPLLVAQTYQQLQQFRPFYSFPDPLDVDRYVIDGEVRDTVIAARGINLDGLPAGQRNWVNDHTVYTHGFGVVAAYGDRAQRGQPAFFESGIPPRGDLPEFQNRIYFGEGNPEYSIVGAPEGASPVEYDYPITGSATPDAEEAAEEAADEAAQGGNQNFTYDGGGGVGIGDPFRRLLFALKFRSGEIILTDRVNSDSRVLYDRDPRQRVEKVAPWLTMDGDPYPAVVDGQLLWILDGYTTSAQYPYSTPTVLDDATATSLTGAPSVQQLQRRTVNYVRNSVKATVDAYTGEVTLYSFDEEDPVLDAWQDIFPGTVTPLSEASGDLIAHFRYPQDLFKVQRTILERYHVDNPDEFFSGEDFWSVPPEPTSSGDNFANPAQPPYYLSIAMPGQESPSFSLTSTFIPTTEGGNARNILRGFLAADGDAGDTPGEVREGYGQLRLLEISDDQTVNGPGQVQNDFDSDSEIADQLNILARGNSQVLRGNLLTLPLNNGFLYVQPVYVQSRAETSFPLLRRVLVAFGDEVGFGATLEEALDDLFGGDSGATAPDAGTTPAEDDTGATGETPPDGSTPAPSDAATEDTATSTLGPTPAVTGDANERLAVALDEANQAIQDGQAALANGDFAGYGEAQQRLQDALDRATQAEEELSGGASTAEPSVAPSPTG